MFKKLGILILIIFNFSCNNNEDLLLKNDKLLAKYFNKSEVNDLEKILKLFENAISKNCNNTVNVCFEKFLENAPDEVYNENFEFLKNLNGEIIQKEISKSTFDKIWYISYMFRSKTKETKPIISIRTESNYIDYLKELCKTKPYLTKYVTFGTNDSGSFIQAVTEIYILKNYKNFNLSDERDKLILAIHYISFGEQL